MHKPLAGSFMGKTQGKQRTRQGVNRPKVINLSTDHCVLNYFFAHYFVLLVDI